MKKRIVIELEAEGGNDYACSACPFYNENNACDMFYSERVCNSVKLSTAEFKSITIKNEGE